jgi:hypothetical protein
MATRVEKILKNARRTLADLDKQRWSDEDLLALLDEGQEDFNQQTQFLNTYVDIVLTEGNPYFSLPDDCWKLTRVLYNNCVLPMVTHRELDEMGATNYRSYTNFLGGSKWEKAEGSPIAIIYDRRDFTQGKVFPIPADLNTESLTTEAFGVVAEETDTVYGLVGSFEGPGGGAAGGDVYGVLVEANIGTLRCYYLKNPKEVTSVSDELDIPQMYDIALKFYVCGQAFLNDVDTGSQQKSGSQLALYARHVKEAKKTAMQDYIQAGAFETTYRRGV